MVRHCNRLVRGTKHLGVGAWLSIVLLSGGTLGFFLFLFIPYFFLIKRYGCPICGATVQRESPRVADAATPQ